MFFPWFLWQPQGTAGPALRVLPAIAPRTHVVLFDPATSRPLRDVAQWQVVTISVDRFGPTQASITLRRGSDDAHHSALLPDGDGALLEVDARGLGLPDVWLGQCESVDEDVTHAAAEGAFPVSVAGPWAWLEDIGIHDYPMRTAPAGQIVSDIVGGHTGAHRLRLGASIHRGAPVAYSAAGGSIGSVLKDLAGITWEYPYLTALPGTGRLQLDWFDPLSVPDARQTVTLLPGRNCTEVKLATKLRRTAAEVVGVARSYVQGVGAQSTAMRGPAGAVVGRRAALAMSIYAAPAGQLAGGPVVIRQDLPSSSTILAEAAGQLRRAASIIPGGSATITDSALYEYMRPNTILSAVFNDGMGLFGRCLVQIRTVTWSLGREDVKRCTCTFDLWEAV